MKFVAEMAVQEITDAFNNKTTSVHSKYKPMAETNSKLSNNQINTTTAAKTCPRTTSLSSSLQSNDGKLPEYLDQLLEGSGVCGDCRVPIQKPDWYDDEKFKRGQKLATDYMFGVMFAHMLSLIIVFAFQSGLEPLIFSGKSDTPFKAFKRYLSTALRVKSWSDTDIWQEGSKGNTNLKVVRGMHEKIRSEMAKEPQDEIGGKVTREGKPRWTATYEEIINDCASSCPMLKHPLEGPKHVYVNQTDMAVTQFAFVGLILLFPKMFGIHGASKEDLEGFSHFWRTIGYLLGIEDRFNLCGADLGTVQRRCADLLEFWVKPSLRNGSRDWIHMSRCATEGISYYVKRGTEFEVVFLYLCYVLSIDAPRLKASLSSRQMFMFNVSCFIYAYLLRVPGVQTLFNWLLGLAIKKGENLPPETIHELQNRVYPYEELVRSSVTNVR